MQTRKLFNLDAEQSILGCILIGGEEQVETIIETVNELDFSAEQHKIIFNSMKCLNRNGIKIDFVTLTDDLEKKNMIDSVGGIEYIAHLTNYVPSASNYEYYINILKEFSNLRVLKKEIMNVLTQIDGGENFETIKANFENSIKRVEELEIDNDVQHIDIVADTQFEKIKNAINGIYDERGLQTGFPILDKKLYGLHKGNLIVIGARAGVGKTAMALNIINNVVVKNNKKVIFFSLEMPKEEIMHRLYSINTQIDGMALRTGNLKSGDFQKIKNAKETYDKSNLYIDDNSSLTVKKMLLKARKFQRKNGLDLIVIDYLQFIRPNIKGGNRFLEVGEIARELKQMARQLNIPVVVLAQLNRGLDKEDRPPVMADLRESGEIENNADVIMFLHSKANDMEEIRNVSLIIGKNRNGERVAIKTIFKGSTFTFSELEKPQKEVAKQQMFEEVKIKEEDLPF
jgi:replicative DNA helicase